MQVSSLNEVKIYSLSCGKSLPEVSSRPLAIALGACISNLPSADRGGWFYVNLTQARVNWKEGISIEKMPP
jgi:hypothetical protein